MSSIFIMIAVLLIFAMSCLSYVLICKLSKAETALLRDRIVEGHQWYVSDGWIPIYVLDTQLELISRYYKLGGKIDFFNIQVDLCELPNDPPNTDTEE